MPPTLREAETKQLRLYTIARRERSMFGEIAVHTIIAHRKNEPLCSGVTASAVMILTPERWVIEMIEVAGDRRRHGYASELLTWIVANYDSPGAAWASPEGMALGRHWATKHGRQESWFFADEHPEIARIVDKVLEDKKSCKSILRPLDEH